MGREAWSEGRGPGAVGRATWDRLAGTGCLGQAVDLGLATWAVGSGPSDEEWWCGLPKGVGAGYCLAWRAWPRGRGREGVAWRARPGLGYQKVVVQATAEWWCTAAHPHRPLVGQGDL